MVGSSRVDLFAAVMLFGVSGEWLLSEVDWNREHVQGGGSKDSVK